MSTGEIHLACLDFYLCALYFSCPIMFVSEMSTYFFLIITVYFMHMHLITVPNVLNLSLLNCFRRPSLVQNLTKCSLWPCHVVNFSYFSVFHLDLCSLWQLCLLCGSRNLSDNGRGWHFTSSVAGINTSCMVSQWN